MDQHWLQWANQAPAPAQGGESEGQNLEFDHRAAARMFQTATDTLGLVGMTMYQTRHSEASNDRVSGFRTLQEVQRRGQWKAFSSVTRDDKSSRLAADYRSLPHARSETSWKHSRNWMRYC